MKPEEARVFLSYMVFIESKTVLSYIKKEALQTAISALEKQIPMKPMIKTDKYNENLCYLFCPTCGSYIGMYNKRLKMGDFYNTTNKNICNRCGRAIDCEVEA